MNWRGAYLLLRANPREALALSLILPVLCLVAVIGSMIAASIMAGPPV